MSIIFNLFGEEVTGVDDTRYVFDLNNPPLMCFADTVLVKIDVFGALEGDRGGPIDCCFVVVVDWDAIGSIGETEILGAMLDGKKVVDTLVSGVDFSHTGTVCCFVLPDGFPSNRPPCTTDDVSREGAKLV